MRWIRNVRLGVFLCALIMVYGGAPVVAQNSLDDAINEALTAFNFLPDNPIRYREVARFVEISGAVVYVEVLDSQTGEIYPGVIDWVYFLRDATGNWKAALPGDADYRSVFNALSSSLREELDDTPYRTAAVPGLVEPEDLLSYRLPFPDGSYGTVTRSYDEHGTGKIDFDLTGREIAAAKDGVIVFASDRYDLTTYRSGAWWYWNVVIVRHGEHEYSLYGHIAPNSIPEHIRAGCAVEHAPVCAVPVRAGEVIALEGNTGFSTNPHLHMEFGQGFGVIPYPDLLDGDRDGDRGEPVYAGYVYAEHNVGFIGYSADAPASWEYLTVLQAEHP